MTYPGYTSLQNAATALGIPESILYAVCNTQILPPAKTWIHPDKEYLINESWLKIKLNQLPAPDIEQEDQFLDWLKG